MDEQYLCEYCGQILGSSDTFRRHLKTKHYSKTREHKCSICGFSTRRLDSIRRHLKSNHHLKGARDITTYILDFLDPPKVKAPQTPYYKADLGTSNRYIYQQSMPKNKEMFPWIPQVLDTAPMPPRVYKPCVLLSKDPLNIPLDSTEELKDPSLEYYPSTSPSWVDSSELSELDQMLRTQLETTSTSLKKTTTDRSTEERTLATQWITLDTIGTVDDFYWG